MILITGAAGFLGNHLVNRLTDMNTDFVCFDRVMPAAGNIKNFYKGDICKAEDLNDCLKQYTITRIIHLAGVIYSKNAEDFYNVNVNGFKNLLDAVKKHSIEQIILLSSLNVILDKKNDYSQSKKLCEELLLESDVQSKVVLRPSVIYGDGGKGYIDKLINRIFSKKVVVSPIENAPYLQPIYVKDLCEKITDEIAKSDLSYRTYFCVGKDIFTYKQLTGHIAELLQRRVFIFLIPFKFTSIVIDAFKFILPNRVKSIAGSISSFLQDKVCPEGSDCYTGRTRISDYIEALENNQ